MSHPNRSRADNSHRPSRASPVRREGLHHERRGVDAVVSKIVDTFTEHSVAKSMYDIFLGYEILFEILFEKLNCEG